MFFAIAHGETRLESVLSRYLSSAHPTAAIPLIAGVSVDTYAWFA